MHTLELANVETGAFFARLVREGEHYGLYQSLVHDSNEPTLEFYDGPVPDDLDKAPFVSRYDAQQFSAPRTGWSSVEWLLISPGNSVEIARWLEALLCEPWNAPVPARASRLHERHGARMQLSESGARRVTLYMGGLLGYTRMEVEWCHVTRGPDAQYVDAFLVDFLPRGSRQPKRSVLQSDPKLVVLLGWGHPRLGEPFVTRQSDAVPTSSVTTHRHPMGHPQFDADFENALLDYIARSPLTQVLLDTRGERVSTNRTSGAPRAVAAGDRDGPAARELHRIWRDASGRTAPAAGAVPSLFVSYHHGRDAVWRERFERRYAAAFASASIYPGELSTLAEAARLIRARVARCDGMVVLVGIETYSRRWVDWEISAALTSAHGRPPKPVVAMVLPDAAELLDLASTHSGVAADLSATEIRRHVDQLSREFLQRVGTVPPLRVLDNVLTGALELVPWDSDAAAVADALIRSSSAGRVVNGRARVRVNELIKPLSHENGSNAVWMAPPTRAFELPPPPPEVQEAVRAAIAGQRQALHARAAAVQARARAQPATLPRDIDGATLLHGLDRFGADAVWLALASGETRLGPLLRQHAHLIRREDHAATIAVTLLSRLGHQPEFGALACGLEAALATSPRLSPIARLPDLAPQSLVQVLRGDGSAVDGIAGNSAGEWLAVSTASGSLTMWDLTSGTPRWCTTAPPGMTFMRGSALASDEDGRWLVAARATGQLEVRDPQTGRALHVFKGRNYVSAFHVDPRGAWVAMVGAGGLLRVWELPSGTLVLETNTGVLPHSDVTSDGSGRRLATLVRDGVGVWDADTWDLALRLKVTGYEPRLLFSPDDRFLVCATGRATTRIWPLPDGSPALDITSRSRRGSNHMDVAAVGASGEWLAAAGRGGSLGAWTLPATTSSKAKRRFLVETHPSGRRDGLTAIVTHDDRIISAGADCDVRIWDAATGVCREHLNGHSDAVDMLKLEPVGTRLMSASRDGDVRVWRLDEPAAAVPDRDATLMATDSAGTWCAFAARDGDSLTIRRAADGGGTDDIIRSDGPPHTRCLAGDPRGTWLAWWADSSLSIWDPATSRRRHELASRNGSDHGRPPHRLEVSPDGRMLASFGSGTRVSLWSPETGELVNTLNSTPEHVSAVAIGPAGRWLAVGSTEGAVRLWPATGRHAHRHLEQPHPAPVRGLAVDQGGSTVVSHAQDGSLNVWDIETARSRRVDLPHPVHHVAIEPSGRWAVCAGNKTPVHIVRFGETLDVTSFGREPLDCGGLAIAPTGRFVATIDTTRSLRVWDTETCSEVAAFHADGTLTSVAWTESAIYVGGARGLYAFAFHVPAVGSRSSAPGRPAF